jgi:hypothetical protein
VIGFFKRHNSKAVWLVVGFLLIYTLWVQQRDTDRIAAAQRRADAAFNALEAETKERTLQNCAQTVGRTDTLRHLLLDAADAQQDPVKRKTTLDYIAKNYPPLRCDDEGHTVVIAVPDPTASTTTTEG